MSATHQAIHVALSGVLIVVGYQFYFWCQRNALFEPRELRSKLDDLIPYAPRWVWIYIGLFFPAILSVNLVLESPEQFTRIASSYALLSVLQFVCFLLLPVRTPPSWRIQPAHSGISHRFLAFLQRFDAPSNSFPSMHTSVAMLTALHLYDHHGLAIFAFPALIGLSCLFTKQHYVVDIPSGAGLGWLVHEFHAMLFVP